MDAPDASEPSFDYDVFVSYSHADEAWVREWLLRALEAASLRVCIDFRDFTVGRPTLVNIERASAHSRYTLVVLTPAWVANAWADFEAMILQSADPAARQGRLLPLLLHDCAPPPRIAMLTYADFRRPDAREAELRRVIAAMQQTHDLSTFSRPLSYQPAVAAALVSALPLDRIPDVAPLPRGSRMPLRANPLFVGRADDLMALAAALKGTSPSPLPRTGEGPGVRAAAVISPIAAATGLGGIGKTQLASEFVHRYGQYFAGGVCWLSFADARIIPAEVAACGGPLGMELPGFGEMKLDEQLARVRQEWQRELPRLLVFDNCEDPALLTQWQPTGGGCRIMLTSRRSQWTRGLNVHALPLGVLNRSESIELLCAFRPDLSADDSDLAAIAATLGDLPLALHLAGSFLETYQHERFGTPAAYLAQLRKDAPLAHVSLQGEGADSSPTAHDLHVGRTFGLSYERLDATNPTDELARKLLARATHFAAGMAIPRELLAATLELGDDDAAALRTAQALQRLLALGLLEEAEEGALRLHPLLALFARAAATDDAAQAAVEQTLLERANQLNNAGYPAALLALQPHLRRVTDAALVRADERAAGLCNTLGYHLQAIGDYAAARSYFERALAIRKQVLGPEHPATARSLNNLGMLLQAHGDYAAARPYLEHALAIREQVLGPEHPDTAGSLNNLGALLDDQGDYVAARPYYERSLAICEQVLGAEHPATARSLNNLGALLSVQGEYVAARLYFERALAIHEQVLGPEHPDTASSLNNLGWLLRTQGDNIAAQPYYQRALAIREQVLGPEHPDTASSLNNLGRLLHDQGDYTGARPYFERALAIDEQVLGPEHPDTALILNNLGALLHDQGDYAAARPYYARALVIREQVLGAEHPDIAASLNNLGRLLHDQGDYAAARPYYARALAIREQVLGAEHPDIAASLNNLGGLLDSQGDYAAARPYFERALAICMARLGTDHPTTRTVQANLAALDAASQSGHP